MIKLKKLIQMFNRSNRQLITFAPPSSPKGRVLYSYLPQVIGLPENHSSFLEHTSRWHARTIANIFLELGYIIDAISWDDNTFYPNKKYDIVFDIHSNIARWESYFSKQTLRLMHITGSDVYYSASAELDRISAATARRPGSYRAMRITPHMDRFRYSMHLADACSIIGNQHTLNTFPETFHSKMTLVTISASHLGNTVKSTNEYIPSNREFLWFFGTGAIHKGLDLVLEAFARNPQWVLHVVGSAGYEKDFVALYRRELFELSNIHYHGELIPSGEAFGQIVRRCVAFIAPSCSEAISSAVVTCLKTGLYPIISRDTGITLPDGIGVYLETSNIDEIIQCVAKVKEMTSDLLSQQIAVIQEYANTNFTRERFYEDMKNFIVREIDRF